MKNDIQKAKADGKIYDLVDFTDYMTNRSIYMDEYTAIQQDEYVLPIRKKTDTRPGVYPSGPVAFFILPQEEEKQDYSAQNIINFSDAETIKDIIEKQERLRNTERGILTTVDNVFVPKINDTDSPEMVGLKQAVIAKKIDLDKYEQRFGPNFNNDKRLFSKDSITMAKLKMMFDVLDMKGTLIIEDKSPDVPNPIGGQIIVDLSGSSISEEDGADNESI